MKAKVAILAARAGYIRRGVESVAYELRKSLPYECTVVSLIESDWTIGVPGITRDMPAHKICCFLYKWLNLRLLDHLMPYGIHAFHRYALEEWSYGWNLSNALDKIKPDVIINLSGPIVGRFCMAYRKRTGVPFVVAGGAGIGRTEMKNVYTRPDKYIAINPEALRFVHKIDKNLDAVLIPNGVNIDLFTPDGGHLTEDALRRLSGKPDLILEHPVVVSTAALDKMKRLHLAIEAMRSLGRGTLLFAGDGPYRREVVSLGDEALGSRFGYLGSFPYTDLADLYRTADVFCMPSVNEPFGNVAVEAMACGVPVVATDDESRKWILGESGGEVVDVTSPAAFADVIKRVGSGKSELNPRLESQRFSWQNIADEYASIIEKLLHNNG